MVGEAVVRSCFVRYDGSCKADEKCSSFGQHDAMPNRELLFFWLHLVSKILVINRLGIVVVTNAAAPMNTGDSPGLLQHKEQGAIICGSTHQHHFAAQASLTIRDAVEIETARRARIARRPAYCIGTRWH